MLTQTLPQAAFKAMQQPSTSTGSNSQAEQQLRAQLELLKSPDAPTSASPRADSRLSESRHHHSISPTGQDQTSNGFDAAAAASHEVARALAAGKTDADAHIHPDLRGIHQAQAQGHSYAPPANMLPIAAPIGHSPTSPLGHNNAALAPAPPQPMDTDDMDGDGDGGDGRSKAKRELSQSKRAAQNRAAQRAFRQRKEGYIKKLEQQVRDFGTMEQAYKNLQSENYALREYVISLQSRLLDSEGEFPSPPDNVNLTHSPSGHAQPQPQSHDSQTVNIGRGTPLEAVAQAVAGLAAHEQLSERYQQQQQQAMKVDPAPNPSEDDTRTAEEINRQLQPPGETGPEQAPTV